MLKEKVVVLLKKFFVEACVGCHQLRCQCWEVLIGDGSVCLNVGLIS